jgi:phage-related protein
MPLVTFSPSIAPSPGTKINPKVNLFEAEFGDGYTQSAPNGLNHIKREITLTWTGLTEAQYQELDGFFFGRGGYRPFYYQPRGFSTPLKWTCKEWSGTDRTPWSFEAKLVEHFTTET